MVVGPRDDTDPVPAETLALLRSDPSVILTGEVRNVAPYLAAMSLLVLPTHREGLGNVLLEAAAMGLPSVASKTTGCVDAVVDGETGVLVPPKDPGALASAICTYLGSEALRVKHGAEARQYVLKRFAQEVVWKAIAAEYEAALRSSHPSYPRTGGFRGKRCNGASGARAAHGSRQNGADGISGLAQASHGSPVVRPRPGGV
jgi:glycosyltransferase involved in cell wall biosynthesis